MTEIHLDGSRKHDWGDPLYEFLIATAVVEGQKNKSYPVSKDNKYLVVFTINGIEYDFKAVAEYLYGRFNDHANDRAKKIIKERLEARISEIEDEMETIRSGLSDMAKDFVDGADEDGADEDWADEV